MLTDDLVQRMCKSALVFYAKCAIFTIRHISNIAACIDQRLGSAQERLALLHAAKTRIANTQTHDLCAGSDAVCSRVLRLRTDDTRDMRTMRSRERNDREQLSVVHDVHRICEQVHFAKVRPLAL